MLIKKKRAQEEMVGFMMIMVLVAIIFLVFLAIFLKKSPSDGGIDSAEISQFLDAALEHTTDCAPYEPNYLKIREVISRCNENAGWTCAEGPDANKKACDVLKDTIKKVINASWNFNKDSPEKGYVFNVIRESSSGPDVSLFPPGQQPHDYSKGPCSDRYRGAEKLLPKNLVVSLKICI